MGQGGLFQGQARVDSGQAQPEARPFDRLSDEMQEYIARLWGDHTDDSLYMELALRADVPQARERLVELLADESASAAAQLDHLRIAQEFPHEKTLPQVQQMALAGATDDIRLAALNVLAGQSDPDLAHELLQAYASGSTAVQSKIRDVVFARVDSAMTFFGESGRGQYRKRVDTHRSTSPRGFARRRPVGRVAAQALGKYWAWFTGRKTGHDAPLQQ